MGHELGQVMFQKDLFVSSVSNDIGKAETIRKGITEIQVGNSGPELARQ